MDREMFTQGESLILCCRAACGRLRWRCPQCGPSIVAGNSHEVPGSTLNVRKQHGAIRSILCATIQHLSQLSAKSWQRTVITNHIDWLALFHDECFLHHSPAWSDNEGIAMPVSERCHTLIKILNRLRRHIGGNCGLPAKGCDCDQIPIASLTMSEHDWGNLWLVCGRRRSVVVGLYQLRQCSRRGFGNVYVIPLESSRRRLRLWL